MNPAICERSVCPQTRDSDTSLVHSGSNPNPRFIPTQCIAFSKPGTSDSYCKKVLCCCESPMLPSSGAEEAGAHTMVCRLARSPPPLQKSTSSCTCYGRNVSDRAERNFVCMSRWPAERHSEHRPLHTDGYFTYVGIASGFGASTRDARAANNLIIVVTALGSESTNSRQCD